MNKKKNYRRANKKEARNRFELICGKSGKGKSFFIADEAHNYLDNPRVKTQNICQFAIYLDSHCKS